MWWRYFIYVCYKGCERAGHTISFLFTKVLKWSEVITKDDTGTLRAVKHYSCVLTKKTQNGHFDLCECFKSPVLVPVTAQQKGCRVRIASLVPVLQPKSLRFSPCRWALDKGELGTGPASESVGLWLLLRLFHISFLNSSVELQSSSSHCLLKSKLPCAGTCCGVHLTFPSSQVWMAYIRHDLRSPLCGLSGVSLFSST